jgi:hypothetical protein
MKMPARELLFILHCGLLLLPRVGGPHLHLCLDGSGPAVTVHLEGDDAAPAADESAHDDRTFAKGSPVVAKVWPPALDGTLPVVVVLLLLSLPGSFPRPARRAAIATPSPLFFRPPLRGPPL